MYHQVKLSRSDDELIKRAYEAQMINQIIHIKVREICYKTFKTQEYMNSHVLTNYEVSLLFALRSRTFRNVKTNVGVKLNCPLGFPILDSQEHWLLCKHTNTNQNTQIE